MLLGIAFIPAVLHSIASVGAAPANTRPVEGSPASTSKCITTGISALGKVSELCVAINIPSEPEAQNDVFMKITGPADRQYTGVGFGTRMNDALMLLLFPSGTNMTASMRLGSGHARPSLAESSIRAELLPGSGTDGSLFTANVRCRNCMTWTTGSIMSTSKAQDMIYAHGQTTGTGFGDTAVTTYHGPFSRGTFKMDMSTAQGLGGLPAIDRDRHRPS